MNKIQKKKSAAKKRKAQTGKKHPNEPCDPQKNFLKSFVFEEAAEKSGKKGFGITAQRIFTVAKAPIADYRTLTKSICLNDFVNRKIFSKFAVCLTFDNKLAQKLVINSVAVKQILVAFKLEL